MNAKINKTNAYLEYLNRRLDGVRMSDFKRRNAKARIAQAEAVADAVAAAGRGIARLFRTLRAKVGRRAAPTAG